MPGLSSWNLGDISTSDKWDGPEHPTGNPISKPVTEWSWGVFPLVLEKFAFPQVL